MWFELERQDRAGMCTTDGCGNLPMWCLEAGDISSKYCSECHDRIKQFSEICKMEPAEAAREVAMADWQNRR